MSRPDDFIPEDVLLAELEAIDATLAGEAVDPAYAEIAEIALLVRAERPEMTPAFASTLDQRVEARFRTLPGEVDRRSRTQGATRRARFRWASWQPAAALAAAAVVAVVVVVSTHNSGPSTELSLPPDHGSAVALAPATAAATTAASTTAGITSSGTAAGPTAASSSASASAGGAKVPSAPVVAAATPAPARQALGSAKATHGRPTPQSGKYTGNFFGSATPSSASSVAQGVQPQSNGRKQIQSAQLALVAPPSRIDTVSQEAFAVIGANQGIVEHSTVTAQGRAGGYAEIRVSVPDQNLARTMTALSQLQYAHVSSRTDMSQDVNDRYVVDQRHLADAQALRTSLLKQLATAYTETAIDSLKAQLADAESSIHSDETTLDSLNKQVSLSQISLTINAGAVPLTPHHHHAAAGGFTIHRALHDAARVLVVTAGVAVIGIAALLPLMVLLAVLLWIGLWMRRRGRESALDAAA